MAVTYSQNGVIVRQDVNLLNRNNKNYVDFYSAYPWCYTPNLNIDNARVIEENIVCKANAYTQGVSYHICGGQWYSGAISKFNGIAVYIWADQIEFDYGDNVSENYDFITGISYDLSKWIRKNIVYDKNSRIATCKIYYDNELVCTYTRAISDLYFANDVPYSVGGTRANTSSTRGFNGIIDFDKSYIKIDGKLAWGTSKLESNEAVIGGKTYRTVQMPDEKIWLAENLDFKFCNIGGSGNPYTANAWYYNNDETTYGWNGYKCGLLYNWYAAKCLNDHRSDLCPGWHVPTKDEWDALATACGGASTAGTKLKALDDSAGTGFPSGWNGTDDYGFAILPTGGYWDSFWNTNRGYYWTQSTYNSTDAYLARFIYNSASVDLINDPFGYGYSLRLVRDAT